MTSRARFTFVGCCLALVLACAVALLFRIAAAPRQGEVHQPPPSQQKQGDIRDGVDLEPIEDGGLQAARIFTAPIHDPGSLTELRSAIELRGRLGLAVLQAESDAVRLNFRAPKDEVARAAGLLHQLGLLNLYEGRYSAAAAAFQKALELGRPGDIPARVRARRTAPLGIAALRRGEAEISPRSPAHTSGIFPIAADASQTILSGPREAIKWFTLFLHDQPDDLRVRWFLNLAYMQLGEYPGKVPTEYLIPLRGFRSTAEVGTFENVVPRAGLASRGPNQAGGSVFDDFNGDGLPDLFLTSLDVDRGASLYLNRGDGTFEDHSDQAGLSDQVFAVNLAHADFDNDGDLDVVLLRGSGEIPLRLSLLKNDGTGGFKDVTIAAGLGEPIATGAAAWGDYDNDGWIDLFVCGEFREHPRDAGTTKPDPRNRCRLYRNRGDATFAQVAEAAGVVNLRCARGAAWGDFDLDGRLDLYVSNENSAGRMYHNEGDGTFRDVAPELELTGPQSADSCWFWDHDNDGRLDLFVNDHRAGLAQAVAFALGMPAESPIRPRLYRNLGTSGFREIGREAGLDRPIPALGFNFGDINNDGYLDLYAGTGSRSCSGIFPNLMLLSEKGRRFTDVTLSSGTGRLEKGQGISFADSDDDGDLDLFVETGGAVPGDRSWNFLFRNPGHGRHWLKVRLVGTRTNRAAIGATIRVEIATKEDGRRSIFRTVGNNSSTGGNSLVQSIGLSDASEVAELTVTWPVSRTTQTFRDVRSNQTVEIIEGAASYQVRQPRPVEARPR